MKLRYLGKRPILKIYFLNGTSKASQGFKDILSVSIYRLGMFACNHVGGSKCALDFVDEYELGKKY